MTLFGESAGGLSVLSQLVSPGARGLFARAIAESGTYNLTQASAGHGRGRRRGLRRQGRLRQPDRRVPAQPCRSPTIVDNEDSAGYQPGHRRAGADPVDRARPGQRAVQPRAGHQRDQPRRVAAVRRASHELDGPAGHGGELPGQIASTLGVSAAAAAAIAAAVPAQRLLQPLRSRSARSAPTRSSPARH